MACYSTLIPVPCSWTSAWNQLCQQSSPWKKKGKKESERHSVVSNSLPPHGLYSPWNSPGQNTGLGSLSLLQGIFPTQGSNLGLPHCEQILYQLSHKGSPRTLEWVAYPFPVDLPNLGIELGSPTLQADSLPTEVSGKLCPEGNWKMQQIRHFSLPRVNIPWLTAGRILPRTSEDTHPLLTKFLTTSGYFWFWNDNLTQ